jgi:hypothetical protein
MDPLSAIATVYSVYELAYKVAMICFRYSEGVKRATDESDAILEEIRIFQKSLERLNGLLLEEVRNGMGAGERFQNLKKIVASDSKLLRGCSGDLEKLYSKLSKDLEHQPGFKGVAKDALRKLKWPLKEEDIKRLMETMRAVAVQIDRAQRIDTTYAITLKSSWTKFADYLDAWSQTSTLKRKR